MSCSSSGARAQFLQVRGQYFQVKEQNLYIRLGHIWLHGCVELLRDGDAADFFYAAQSCCTITIEARDNDSDKLPPQCCVRERRKTVITSGYLRSFDIGFRF
jgi:hypothetical protein